MVTNLNEAIGHLLRRIDEVAEAKLTDAQLEGLADVLDGGLSAHQAAVVASFFGSAAMVRVCQEVGEVRS